MQRNRHDAQALIKISRPRLAETLARERLFAKLDEARCSAAMWIMGPAGSGKTTLVGSYVDARRLPCLWYQVDDGDEDIATFFYHLGLAGQQTDAHQLESLPFLSPDHARESSTFARNFFAELFSRLPKRAVLVFDNFQEVAVDSALQEVVRIGLEMVPQGNQVFMVSRHAPPRAFARLRANARMTLLGWPELKLTHGEAEEIAAFRDVQLSELPASWLTRIEGWVAGLVLLLEWLRIEEVEPEGLGEFMPEVVFDYFASELLDRISPDVRDLLLQGAVAPRMDADIMRALTGDNRIERILDELHRRNFFLTRHVNARKVYQFHPMFREFLLMQAEQSLAPDRLKRLRRDLASLLRGAGDVEDAIDLMQQCHDWIAMTALIKEQAHALLAQGRGQTLMGWLTALPEQVRSRDPWLICWQGRCLQGQNLQRSLAYFERAFFQFCEVKDSTGVYSAWCGAVDCIHVDWGGTQSRWDDWIGRLEELVQAGLEFTSAEIECAVAQRISVALECRMPAHPRRVYWKERLLTVAAKSGDSALEVTGLAHAIFSDTHRDLTRAGILVETLCSRLDANRVSPSVKSLAYAALATYYCAVGRVVEMREAAEAGIALTERAGTHAWGYICHYWVGAAAFLTGELDQGREKLRYLKTRPEARGCAGAFYCRQLATWDSVLRADYGQALVHAQASLRHAQECSFPLLKVCGKADLAWVLDRFGECDAARVLVDQALDRAREIGTLWLERAVVGLRAFFSFADGDEVAGTGYLSAERNLARSQGYTAGTGVWMGGSFPVARCLFNKSLELKIEPEVTRRQIQLLDIMPDEGTVRLEGWPWAVRIYTLGRFEILRDDQPLSFSRKSPKMPLRLLKTLIALGGRSVSEVQLIEALWPDAEGDAGHRSVATALHRLRGLLGDEVIILNEQRLSINPRRAWIDVWAFEYLLARVQGNEQRQDHQTALLSSLEQALALYRGPFLTGEPAAPWSGSMRNRLRARFVGAVRDLARQWEKASDWNQALACYQRGLEMDDLAEEFYQGVMRAHYQLGNRARALDAYHCCKRHLSISLSIRPSSATETIYKSIRNG